MLTPFRMAEKVAISDIQLVDRLKSGDESALTAMYKKYWQQLFIAAYNVLKDKEACEDVIQELFIKLWNSRSNIEIVISLKAYLHASVRYEVYRQIRAGVVSIDVSDDLANRLQSAGTYENLEYKELVAQVNSVVETLPEKCREVYKLSREEYLTHKQIASRLNISTKTVENHLTKALKLLRSSLGSLFLL